jgi:hypothetical protein
VLSDRSPKVRLLIDQQFQRWTFIHRQILLDFVNQLVLEEEAYTYTY